MPTWQRKRAAIALEELYTISTNATRCGGTERQLRGTQDPGDIQSGGEDQGCNHKHGYRGP